MKEILERLTVLENKIDVLISALVPAEKPKILLSDYLEIWLKDFRTGVAPSTLYKDTNNIRCHIIPALGYCELTELTTLQIQQYLNAIKAPRQREHIYVLLKSALRKATELGYIDNNPVLSVVMQEHESQPTEILSPEDTERLLYLARQTPYYTAFYTLLYQGFRPSELLALDRDNLLDDSIYVTHSWNSKQKRRDKTKTKYSVRKVPYFADVRQALTQLPCIERLFPYQLRHLEDCFKDIVRSRDFLGSLVPRERLTLYSLRHTCITRWAESGVHPRIAMKWAGHNNISTTLHYYTHISAEWEQKEVLKTSKSKKN